MLTFKIAWRNVFRQKRRTILTMLTMFGGFVLASISIGWSDGSYANIIDLFTRNWLGHIQVHREGYLDRPALYKNIPDYLEVGQKIAETKGVEAWTPRLYAAGLVSVEDKSAGAQIIGIDPGRENIATNFDKKVIRGKSLPQKPNHEVLLGKNLARTLDADTGQEIVVVSQAADGSIANDLYTIAGIVSSGNLATDQSGFIMDLSEAQELFALDGRVHEIVVIVKHLRDVQDVAARIESNLADSTLSVAPWQEFAKSFYVAMKADQEGAWIMLLIILIIVAVGVLNTVLMSVLERTREYGVLRSLGTRQGQIIRLVLYEVAVMAVLSIVIGVVVGLGANYWLSQTGIKIGEGLTYGGVVFDTMKSEINARSFYIPAIAVLISAILVSLYPAGKAAKVPPAKAMRLH